MIETFFSHFSDMTIVWTIAWQTTLWLLLGTAASTLWCGHPAKAHRLLALAVAAALITPALTIAVQCVNWGVIPPWAASRDPGVPLTLPGHIADSPAAAGPRWSSAVVRDGVASTPVGTAESSVASRGEGVSAPLTKSGGSARLPLRSLLLWSWAGLSLLAAGRLLRSFVGARRLLLGQQPVENSQLRRALEESQEKLGLRRAPRLCSSAAVRCPVIWCWTRRPVLLVPEEGAGWPSGMDWVSIFCHELAHWKRRDHLTGLLAEFAVAALPWHPLFWWARYRLGRLSELACDDWVLASGRPQADYAEALLQLKPQGRLGPATAVICSRNSLAVRIGRILSRRPGNPVAGRRWTVLAGTVILLLAAAIALAQPRSELADSTGSETTGPVSEAKEDSKMQQTTTIVGRVVGPQGQPVAGARVAVVGESARPLRGGDLGTGYTKTLGLGQTDAGGRFDLAVPQVSSAGYRDVYAMAAADGLGLGFQPVSLDTDRPQVEIRLPAEQIIRGRAVDSEGQPARDAAVHVSRIGKVVHGLCTGVRFWEPPTDLPLWPGPAITDQQGQFVLRGLNRDEGVLVQVRDDRYAPEAVQLKPVGKEAPDEVTLSLSASRIVEGLVVYEDTGKPVRNGRVTVYASQLSIDEGREYVSAWIGFGGQADAEGRFRVNPYPGRDFWVTAYPPDDQPYLALRKEMPWPEGGDRLTVEISVPRGILVEGRVTEAGSGKPVAGAAVQYHPARAKEVQRPKGIVTRGEAMVVSDDEGVFKIAAPAGLGYLLVHGPTPDYTHRVVGSRELYEGEPGGLRYYVHGLVRLGLEPETEVHKVAVELQPGVTVKGRLLDPGGQPVAEALMLSRLDITPHSPTWRGLPATVRDGVFLLRGCDPEETYPVVFLDPENEIGARVEISGNQAEGPPVEVRLKPCGKATARFVDPDGKPLVDYEPAFMLVMTPGVCRYNREAQAAGQLAADEEGVVNIDRPHYAPWPSPDRPAVPRTDDQGRIAFPDLVPGATYRVVSGEEGWVVKREFSVEPGQKLDLGGIVIQERRQSGE